MHYVLHVLLTKRFHKKFYCTLLFLFLQIVWDKRLNTRLPRRSSVSIDGTDCCIFEATSFSSKQYSHKFNGAALRYKTAVSLEAEIVWVFSPFPAGSYSDDKIIFIKLDEMFLGNETFIVDGGYSSTKKVKDNRLNFIFKNIRARQETINRKLNIYFILSFVFRHHIITWIMFLCCLANG